MLEAVLEQILLARLVRYFYTNKALELSQFAQSGLTIFVSSGGNIERSIDSTRSVDYLLIPITILLRQNPIRIFLCTVCTLQSCSKPPLYIPHILFYIVFNFPKEENKSRL